MHISKCVLNALFGGLSICFFILGFIGVGTMYAFFHDDSARWFQQLGYTAMSLVISIFGSLMFRSHLVETSVAKWYSVVTNGRREYSVQMSNVEDLTDIGEEDMTKI